MMKILIGSYNKGIYEVIIDNKTNRFIDKKMINDYSKTSYLMADLDLSFIYSKDDLGYIKIGTQDLLLNEGPTHLSYDQKNNSIYTSFYGAGLLKVLREKDGWFIDQEIKYEQGSNIHYASFIETVNQVGVVDLKYNKIFFYENNNKLELKQTLTFDKDYGPRHFIAHPTLPIIYVLSELIPTIHVLIYEDGSFKEKAQFELEKGAGSAIRISNDGLNLFAAVRFSNLLYHFNLDTNGNLTFNQVYSTYGDHPRDFDLINNDKHLVVLNMYSNNLTLFELKDNKLILRDKDFELDQGASIIYCK